MKYRWTELTVVKLGEGYMGVCLTLYYYVSMKIFVLKS